MLLWVNVIQVVQTLSSQTLSSQPAPEELIRHRCHDACQHNVSCLFISFPHPGSSGIQELYSISHSQAQ